MNNIVAIIPARSGSKSITDKNISRLSGHPLIAYSIAAAQMTSQIGRIIVSTDSEEYAKVARKYGAEVPFIRPAEYATDISPDRDFIIHVINWLKENENQTPEYWVHLRPTTPLRDPLLISNAIQQIILNKESTSLRSAHIAPESPLKWFRKDGNGYFTSLLMEEDKSEKSNLPKQLFEKVYIPNGYVDIIKRSFVCDNYLVHGTKILAFDTPVTTEVDSLEEFEYLKYQLYKDSSPLLEYLNDNYIDLNNYHD